MNRFSSIYCNYAVVPQSFTWGLCFSSSTNLIWIENGHLISFEESTVAPCWLLGTTIKPAGSRLTQGFLSDLKQQSQILLGHHDFHSITGALKLNLQPCHTYFCQSDFPEFLTEKNNLILGYIKIIQLDNLFLNCDNNLESDRKNLMSWKLERISIWGC